MEEQWWIRQGEDTQGPFSRAALKRFVKSGKATREMSYSTDRLVWRPGKDVPEIFGLGGPPPTPGKGSAGSVPRPSRYPDMEAYAAVFEDGPSRVVAPRRRRAPATVYVAALITLLGAAARAVLAVILIASVSEELGLGLWLLVGSAYYVCMAWLLVKGEPVASTMVLYSNFLLILGSMTRLSGSTAWWAWLDMLLAGIVIAILVTDPAHTFFRGRRGKPRRYRSR